MSVSSTPLYPSKGRKIRNSSTANAPRTSASWSKRSMGITRLLGLLNIIMMTTPNTAVVANGNNVHTSGFEHSAATIMEQSISSLLSSKGKSTNEQSTTPFNAGRRIEGDVISAIQKKTQPIRIHFVTDPLDQAVAASNNEAQKEAGKLIKTLFLPRVATEFAQAISVEPVSRITVPNTVCEGLYQPYIPERIVVRDADLIIIVSAFTSVTDSDGNVHQWCDPDANSGTLASATACSQDADTSRPIIGLVNVCLATTAAQEAKSIEEILSHELLHVLAMSEFLFPFYRNSRDGTPLTTNPFNVKPTSCVNGHGAKYFYDISSSTVALRTEKVTSNARRVDRNYYEITLPSVKQVIRNQFNCQSLTGARLENQPTSESSCLGSHFDERFFQYHMMSAIYDSTSAHFTALTLALLEDSGWYKADFTKAENSPFGLNSGCGFATEDCIVNGDLPAYSEGNFCNDYAGNKISTCGPGHKFRGVCDLFDYRLSGGSLARPEREYFSNVYFGPKISVLSDYCPTVVRFAGFSADCNDLSATKIDKVEVFSDNSRCMDVSINNGSKTSVCISGTCDNDAKRYVFDVGNKSYYCGYGEDGTTIKASHNGKSYSFTCPRLVQVCPDMFCPAMCSGKGVCDWDVIPFPVCKCDDPNDTTAGCFKTAPRAYNESPVVESSGLRSFTSLVVLSISFVVTLMSLL